MMRTHRLQFGTTMLRGMMLAVLAIGIAGCSDVLAVAGLGRLDGVWTARYDSGVDFYLGLDDDLYGLYGRAGFTESSTTPGASSAYVYVNGERDGSHVVFHADDHDRYGTTPIFEGHVTGRDRIDGIVYLDLLPKTVVLRRR